MTTQIEWNGNQVCVNPKYVAVHSDLRHRAIIHAVDTGLGILGESGRRATLYHLALAGVTQEDIPMKFAQFLATLKTIFGSGAEVLETAIMSELARQRKATPQVAGSARY